MTTRSVAFAVKCWAASSSLVLALFAATPGLSVTTGIRSIELALGSGQRLRIPDWLVIIWLSINRLLLPSLVPAVVSGFVVFLDKGTLAIRTLFSDPGRESGRWREVACAGPVWLIIVLIWCGFVTARVIFMG